MKQKFLSQVEISLVMREISANLSVSGISNGPENDPCILPVIDDFTGRIKYIYFLGCKARC